MDFGRQFCPRLHVFAYNKRHRHQNRETFSALWPFSSTSGLDLVAIGLDLDGSGLQHATWQFGLELEMFLHCKMECFRKAI